MLARCLTLLLMLMLHLAATAQIVIIIPTGLFVGGTMPEHGFLPGKKFQFYPTLGKYDFTGMKCRIEVWDSRAVANLTKVDCSDVSFTNTSEFAEPGCIGLLAKYIDTLFKQARGTIDTSSVDTMKIRLEGIDARLIGSFSIRAHGLCQIEVSYHHQTKIYCVDITDADKDSPIKPTAFVSRKTATRVIGSAAMREVIEQFFNDLKNQPVANTH